VGASENVSQKTPCSAQVRPSPNDEAVLTEERRREEKSVLEGEVFMVKTGASRERTPTPTTGLDRINERQGRRKAEAKRERKRECGG
jgi:hypothetical protein